MRLATAAFALLAPVVVTPLADAQALLADLNQAPVSFAASADPIPQVVSGGYVYFTAEQWQTGRELWRSDGTAAGTSMVIELYPGRLDGIGGEVIVDAAGTLYFAGITPSGVGVWRTDGTAAGTTLVTPPLSRLGNGPLTAVGTDVYFWADDGTNGTELWKTSGTLQSTAMVADIHPSGSGHPGRNPVDMVAIGSVLYFAANDGQSGTELWRTDGTGPGTAMVADLNAGAASSDPHGLVDLAGALLFAATPTGATMDSWHKVAAPGAGVSQVTTVVEPRVAVNADTKLVHGGVLYFQGYSAGNGVELWRTDGTGAGTFLVRDIHTGGNGNPSGFASFGAELFFSAYTPFTGYELWKSDGTHSGTVLVQDIEPGGLSSRPGSFALWNGELYFIAIRQLLGTELYATDGTGRGTRLVAAVPLGLAATIYGDMLPTPNGLFFSADGGTGAEPWLSDGTYAGTAKILEIAIARSSSNPRFLMGHRDKMYFMADDGYNGLGPWVTDGTPAGTLSIRAPIPVRWSTVADMELWRGQPYFIKDDGVWRTQGTPSSTEQVVAAVPQTRELEAVGDTLYFSGNQNGLWSIGGASGTTQLVRAFDPTGLVAESFAPHLLIEANGVLFFVASEGAGGESGLFVSDGTAHGTQLVVAHTFTRFSPFGARNFDVAAASTGVFFSLEDEIWFSDGTTSTSLTSWSPGFGWNTEIEVVADVVYFAATDAATGRELWRSDGTVAGTTRLADIHKGPASSDPRGLTAAGGWLWFAADDGRNGTELWRSDGTAGNTVMVVDSWPGRIGGDPTHIRPAGSGRRVVFTVATPQTGREPWVSDGTAQGTAQLADIHAGAAGSGASGFDRAGTTIYFAADITATGNELWSMPLVVTEGNLAEAYGTGCPGTGGKVPTIGSAGLPTLGNLAFQVLLDEAAVLSPAATLLSLVPAALPFGGSCELLLGNPLFAVPTVTDAGGRASLTAGVSAQPALLGAELRCQWIIADPAGAFLNALAFSGALHVMYGR